MEGTVNPACAAGVNASAKDTAARAISILFIDRLRVFSSLWSHYCRGGVPCAVPAGTWAVRRVDAGALGDGLREVVAVVRGHLAVGDRDGENACDVVAVERCRGRRGRGRAQERVSCGRQYGVALRRGHIDAHLRGGDGGEQ